MIYSRIGFLFALAMCIVMFSLWQLRLFVDSQQRVVVVQRRLEPPPTFTVVVTMDCSVYSEWQAVIAIGSLVTLREQAGADAPPFRIVRLVSCNAGDGGVHERTRMYGDELRVSPAIGDPYPDEPVRGFVFPTLNKPYAIHEWLFNSSSGAALRDNDEVVIVDTDFLFLRLPTFGASALGRPAGSRFYYLGGAWLTDANSAVRRFCSDKCGNVSTAFVEENYDVGPPYYVRARDLRLIAPRWWNMTHEMVRAANPKVAWSAPGGWLADMYAYSMAALEHDLPHTLLRDQMVYVTDHVLLANGSQPTVLHFCQNYNYSGVVVFGKHDWHKASLLDCAKIADDPLHFFRRHPFEPPPWLLADEPVRISLARAHDGDLARLRWFLWNIRRGFEQQLTRWASLNC
jgi:hypothetical protein